MTRAAKLDKYKVTTDYYPSISQDERVRFLVLHYTAINTESSLKVLTQKDVSAHYLVNDYDVIIAGTRKTLPAIGKFDKKKKKIGGADTHRFSLDDMVLIKDNHIASVGTPLETLLKAKENVSFSKKIEIEVESLKDAVDCVENKADIVMLDNMSPKEVEEVLEELIKLNIRDNSLIEVSGGITAENIVDYAKLGIDIISLGALTHSSRSLNFSLRILED